MDGGEEDMRVCRLSIAVVVIGIAIDDGGEVE